SSSAKLERTLDQQVDRRGHFQTRFYGAHTGRETGSGFQPLNMPRGRGHEGAEELTDILRTNDTDTIQLFEGDIMGAVKDSLRHWIHSPSDLIVADYTAIEAVVLACLAGEEWKIEAFRNKEPLYERTAERLFNLRPGSVKKDSPERQIGKVCELAFGYQGSVGAYRRFDPKTELTDEQIVNVCRAWRSANSRIRSLWYDLNDTCVVTIHTRQPRVLNRYLFVDMEGPHMRIRLPSGRHLYYRNARLVQEPNPQQEDEPRMVVVYDSPRFGEERTYGGKLVENVTQAVARDLLQYALVALTEPRNVFSECYGRVVFAVYDEIVAEAHPWADASRALKSLLGTMTNARPAWADNWPINADGWYGKRYAK
ncbi:MAG: hypothetical protein VW405_15295, partial [Rhodospirillaceae bacterium]